MDILSATNASAAEVIVNEYDDHWSGPAATWKAGLWFVVIAFMFFAQHHVCDCYFVPAINVFVMQMRKSPMKCARRWGDDAVAGATICALGCNGPELFSNLISLFTGSDAGLGVVVGSEIFNLLIIVGCATIASPVSPLRLQKVPFSRDCFFYAVSIILLYLVMQDQSVDFVESCGLLACAAIYVAAVYFTEDIVNMFGGGSGSEVAVADGPAKKKGKMHGVEVEITQLLHSRMSDGNQEEGDKFMIDAEPNGINAVPTEETMARQTSLKQSESQNRMKSVGFQYQAGDDPMLGAMMKYKDLKEVVVLAEGIINLEFYSGLGHVTLQFNCGDSDKRDELLDLIKLHSHTKPYIHGYDATVVGAWNDFIAAWSHKGHGIVHKLLSIPEFLIDFLLKATLFAVDVKDITRESRWPMCFMGAMMWLAVFSFAMLEVANEITFNTKGALTPAFLGITVCAIGTSFPNAVASIIMAQQNKPAAAVANALGSNVQNVFLAMAMPWVIFSAVGGGAACVAGEVCNTKFGFLAIPQEADDILQGVLWMLGTLALLLVMVGIQGVVGEKWTISRPIGYILVSVFVFYLSLTSFNALA